MEMTAESNPVEGKWKFIMTSICKAAEETLDEFMLVRNEWFNESCREAIELKIHARQNVLQRNTRSNRENYRMRRREAKKICKQEKRKMLQTRLITVERLHRENERRTFYKEVEWFRKGFQPRLKDCKSKSGKDLEGEKEVMNRWTEYFSELLNVNLDESGKADKESFYAQPQQMIDVPDKEEVNFAIEELKNHKAPGEDRLVAELIKSSGDGMKDLVYELICDIWNGEVMPEDWKQGLIYPIFKKGRKDQCSNYRGITLLGVLYKLLSNLILRRLRMYAEEILGDYQCGFRFGRGTTDQIFVIRQVMERCYEYDVDLCFLFIDYKQAFDSVKRAALLKILAKNGVPQKLVNLVSMTMDGASSRVMIGNQVGESFKVQSGVRQGDALSAILFNIVLHDAVKDAVKAGTIADKTWQLCAYADDLVIIARSEAALREAFGIIHGGGTKVGLVINEDKTKFLKMSSAVNRRSLSPINILNFQFESVPSFNYLGSSINNENKIKYEIESRVMAGNRAYFANLNLLKSKLLSRSTKVRLYKTLIRPVVSYGAETWCLSHSDAHKLKVFERKIIRRICGATLVNGIWKVKSNHEIESLLGSENLVNVIKTSRLRWAGHVARMENKRAPKKMLGMSFIKKRKKGRPRSRWEDEVERDARKLGAWSWKREALDRVKWRKLVQEAKGHPDL